MGMTNAATLDKMREMRLYGMVNAYHSTMETGMKHKFTADELLAYLLDSEWEDRKHRKLNRLIKGAKFRYKASMEQIDFTLKRNLDKNEIHRFGNCSWIQKKRNIIITGPCGVGKSFIACALGHSACVNEYRTLYFNCRKLFSSLRCAKGDGTYIKEINKIQRHDLILLDDFGLEHLDTENRLSLLEIIEDRYGKKSTIVISQLPIVKWHDIIKDKTIADAICDRLVHNSFRVNLKGVSVRKIYSKQLTK